MKIFHLITSLDVGGAETTLHRLLAHMDSTSFQSEVISLTPIGRIGKAIKALGIPIRTLGMRPGWPAPSALLRLATWLRRGEPDLLQTWLYHADLLGLLAAGLAGGPAVVWNVRSSNADMSRYRRLSGWTVRVCAKISNRPEAVIVNSEAGLLYHDRIGYHPKKWIVLPNGIDTERFQPDLNARLSVRKELGLNPDTFLVGYVARFDPMKDHDTFFHAIQIMLKTHPDTHFLLCGSGISHNNPKLVSFVETQSVTSSVSLLGEREDIPRLTAAMDVASSSSISEGFPNILAEAMACGVPCAATDAGDASRIIGDTGFVVPVGDHVKLASTWQKLLEMGAEARSKMGRRARARIREEFSLESMIQRYEQLYREIVEAR